MVAVGLAVARMGGRARTAALVHSAAEPATAVADEPGPAAGPAAGSLARLTVLALPLLAALGLGLVFGRSAAYNRSLGELNAVFAFVFLIVEVGGLVLLALAVATVAWLARGRRGSTAIRTLLLAAGALVLGAVGGVVSAPATGGEYQAPITLQSGGQGTLTLAGTTPAFAGTVNSPISCVSVPDGRSVQSVLGLAFGELGSGTIRGTVSGGSGDAWSVELYVDGGDIADGAAQPFWRGPVMIDHVDPDGISGKVTFSDLRLEAGKDAVASAIPGWPATLSGSLGWTCQAWSTGS